MERLRLKINIDKDSKRLIIFNLYVLFSLISAGIINEIFKDVIVEVHTPILIGLLIGLIAIALFMKFIKVLSKNKSVSNNG